MKFKPFGHRILIKVDSEEQVSAGGIVLPSKDERHGAGCDSGVVVEVGKTVHSYFKTYYSYEDEELVIKPGDKVIFVRYSGYEVKDGTKRYRSINPEDIVLIVNEE